MPPVQLTSAEKRLLTAVANAYQANPRAQELFNIRYPEIRDSSAVIRDTLGAFDGALMSDDATRGFLNATASAQEKLNPQHDNPLSLRVCAQSDHPREALLEIIFFNTIYIDSPIESEIQQAARAVQEEQRIAGLPFGQRLLHTARDYASPLRGGLAGTALLAIITAVAIGALLPWTRIPFAVFAGGVTALALFCPSQALEEEEIDFHVIKDLWVQAKLKDIQCRLIPFQEHR